MHHGWVRHSEGSLDHYSRALCHLAGMYLMYSWKEDRVIDVGMLGMLVVVEEVVDGMIYPTEQWKQP